MRSLVAYTLLATATLTFAVDPRFEFPDTVPLIKRQQPGTPQYACHEDCGLLITLAREDKGFCGSQEWNEHYDQCMQCAETYGIWKYYGSGVSKVAEQCDLSPTPSPSGAVAEDPATSSTLGSGTSISFKTTTASLAEVTSTIIPVESSVLTTRSATTTTDVSSGDDRTPVNTPTSTPEPSTVVVNGAAKHFEFTTAIAFVAFTIYSLY